MTRQEINLQILDILLQDVLRYPAERFSQILYNTAAVQRGLPNAWRDEFYLESKALLERMKGANE